jgi:hypothetical protein
MGLGGFGFLDLDLGDGLLLIPCLLCDFFVRIQGKIVPDSAIFFLDVGPRQWARSIRSNKVPMGGMGAASST